MSIDVMLDPQISAILNRHIMEGPYGPMGGTRTVRLVIPDYQTAMRLIKSISDAAEAFLKDRENKGE